MILSDSKIKEKINSGEIGIKGVDFIDSQIGPSSLDFRLGNSFKYYNKNKTKIIDPLKNQSSNLVSIKLEDDGEFIIHPGDFVLGVTKETIKMPKNLVARCEGRSSIGRLGIIIHSTAGFIDPGFEGTITLEITNINNVPVILRPGMRIGQFAFETIDGEVDVCYATRKSSKYMYQNEAQESKLNIDYENL